jgi:hypothetical protein
MLRKALAIRQLSMSGRLAVLRSKPQLDFPTIFSVNFRSIVSRKPILGSF